MGSFSWYASDTNRAIRSDNPFPVYALQPNGEPLLEVDYEGYGRFGGQDIYDLVADWNRKYLAEHPEFLIVQHEQVYSKELDAYVAVPPKRVDEFPWYPAYADLSKTRAEVVQAMEKLKLPFTEYRSIGIDIACFDSQNFSLPFPIKLVEKPVPYHAAGASVGDPEQGWGEKDRFNDRDKTIDGIISYLAKHGLALRDFSDVALPEVDDGLTVRLELEKPMEDPNRVGEIFYRYGIGDYQFWFTQNSEDGNIYSVTVAPRCGAADEFRLYVTHEGRDVYYPNTFEVHAYAPTMTSGQAREYAKRLEQACVVLDKIEEFFKTSKHYEIYRKAQEKSADVQPERLPSDEDLISCQEVLASVKRCLTEGKLGGLEVFSEEFEVAWKAIAAFGFHNGDLVSRGELRDELMGHFGMDLAYVGKDVQVFQEAVDLIPAVAPAIGCSSKDSIDAVLANATDKSKALVVDVVVKGDVDLGKE